MSKIYDTYISLKKQDSKTIYLFKSGIFFIAIDDDATTLSNIFHFKIGNLTEDIIKCGFPCASIDKYSKLFNAHNLSIKIVELNTKTLYTFNNYEQKQEILELLECINTVDINTLSVSEAYQWIENLKHKVKEINNGEN